VELRSGSGFSPIASSGDLETNIGSQAKVGTIFSTARVFLRDQARVFGSAISAADIAQQNGVVVSGQVIQHTPVDFSDLSCLAPQFTLPAPPPLNLEPDEIRAIDPGSYGALTVKARAKLTLRSATSAATRYTFESVMLEPESEVILEGGGENVYIYVRSAFTARGDFHEPTGRADRLLIGFLGTGAASLERPFFGTFVAPHGKIELRSVSAPGHVGSFLGHRIEVFAWNTVTFVPFSGDFVP
jgi:hypothetical protein